MKCAEPNVLLHVVDISHPDFEDHIESVNSILQDIKSADKPTIMVFNKIDAYKHRILSDEITQRKNHQALHFGGLEKILDVESRREPRLIHFGDQQRRKFLRNFGRKWYAAVPRNPHYAFPLQQVFVSRL